MYYFTNVKKKEEKKKNPKLSCQECQARGHNKVRLSLSRFFWFLEKQKNKTINVNNYK